MLKEIPVTVPLGTQTSGVANLRGLHVIGFYVPATWDGGALTPQASRDNSVWGGVKDVGGTALTVASPTAAGFYYLSADVLSGVEYLRFTTGSAPAADRTIVFVARV